MLRRFFPLILVLVVMTLFGLQTACFYPHLPERMASHFGPSGQPDGWMPKGAFVTTYGVFLLFLTVIITSTSLLFRFVPTDMINLPNKEYWLAPEHKPQTLRRLSSHMLSLAVATSMLELTIFQMVLIANLMLSPHLGVVLLGPIAIFIAYMATWVTSLVRAFQIPRA